MYKNEARLIGHLSTITSLSYNFDGSIIASASNDGIVKIWETLSNKELKTIKHDS